MRAAGITALGGPVQILEFDEVAQPAADEVLIAVARAGIGNWDELVRIGSWEIGGPAPMALGTSDAGRLGVCAAEACDRVYLDGSRNGGRQFCSTRCQSRTKAAAHRARHSGQGSGPARS